MIGGSSYKCRRIATQALLACVLAAVSACSPSPEDQAREANLEALRIGKNGGNIEAQLQQVDRCIALQPAAADCLSLRGKLRMRLDRPREAREDFDRAIAADNHPDIHSHRAQALCALGDYEAALADFDTAIAGQPWQESLYPQRALARLAVGRIVEARADLERRGPPAGYAGAALLFMEGHPTQSIAMLDALATQQSAGTAGSNFDLPRVLRMLAFVALDQRELAIGEFDPRRLAAAAHSPAVGYEYWFVPRSCANAFLSARAGETIKRAREIFATITDQRAANVRLAALRESCPSLAAKIQGTQNETAAWTTLAGLLTDGMLTENEERCAYNRLNDLVMGDASAMDLFVTRIAPLLADSARASDHADRWLGNAAAARFRAIKNALADNKVVRYPTALVPLGLRPRPFWIERNGASHHGTTGSRFAARGLRCGSGKTRGAEPHTNGSRP